MVQAFLWGITIHIGIWKRSLQLCIISIWLELEIVMYQNLPWQFCNNLVYAKAYLCKPADLLTILFTLKSSDDIERPSHFSWRSSLLTYEKCIFHRLLLIWCSCLCYLSCHMLSPCDSLPETICTASALAKLLQAVIMIEPWALPLKSKMKNLNRPLSKLLSYMWNWCQNIRAAPKSNWYG